MFQVRGASDIWTERQNLQFIYLEDEKIKQNDLIFFLFLFIHFVFTTTFLHWPSCQFSICLYQTYCDSAKKFSIGHGRKLSFSHDGSKKYICTALFLYCSVLIDCIIICHLYSNYANIIQNFLF